MIDESVILWLALVSYVVAGCTAIIGTILRRMPERIVLTLIVAGLLLHTLAIGLRWERLDHGPFITMFEILSSNIWSLTLIFTLSYWRIPLIRPSAAIVMPMLFIMMGWMMLNDDSPGQLPSTYHTIWLYVHIILGKIFLGSVLVAVGLAGVILLRLTNAGRIFSGMPESKNLDELAYRFMALGLVFDSLMLVSGAIWAQDAWGRYWSWDPLETWAFLTWLWLALNIHMRFTLHTKPATGAIMIMVVFCMAFLTFFGIPFISTSPHKGMV